MGLSRSAWESVDFLSAPLGVRMGFARRSPFDNREMNDRDTCACGSGDAGRRPWGGYQTLAEAGGYKVKRIVVTPGQSLSLQYHHQRSEHWVVVRGQALVRVGTQEFTTEPGQHRFIPLGEQHRLTNIGAGELVLIEVQYGAYLGEDDIVRLDDRYGRA
jgi:mannose-1-phosphate guanylyltransferase / mannose-6-phosphate isomerase